MAAETILMVEILSLPLVETLKLPLNQAQNLKPQHPLRMIPLWI
jgi:hypothetical protein